MASYRKGQFQGGTPRIPIRGFANLFRELDPAVADNLRGIFSEAENLLDFHARTIPQRQTRRKLSGLVDAPVVTAESSFIGASVRWNRLNDSRISMYEVQFSDDNTFSAPETFTVIETFFAVENLQSTKYLRVRGVRYDGLTGNWSNTVSVAPIVSGPVIFTDVFYTSYNSNSEPGLESTVKFAGANIPTFYTLFSTTFIPTVDAGGMMVWGQVSNRLKQKKNADGRVWDRVRFRVNGITRMEQSYCHWTDPAVIDANTPIVVGGEPVNFYGHGGYTAAFGPYMAQFPGMIRGQGPQDPRTVENFYIEGFDLSWSGTKFVKRPARYDLSPSDLFTSIASSADEAKILNLPSNRTTMFLGCTNFGFEVPSNATITGIEAKIKRRKSRKVISPILSDLGSATILRHLDASDPSVDSDNLVHREEYGTVLSLNPASGFDRVMADVVTPSDVLEIANSWTISMWFSIDEDLPGIGTEWIFILGTNGAGTAANEVSFMWEKGPEDFRIRINDFTAGGSVVYVPDQAVSDLIRDGIVHHIVVTWDGEPQLFVDGIFRPITVVTGSPLTDPMTDTARNVAFATNDIVGTSGQYLQSSYGQTAIWNTVLSSSAIGDIFKGKSSIDLRAAFGAYNNQANLKHYYFLFPDQGDIQDHSVYLITKQGNEPKIRTDWDNKAIMELWPRFEKFNSDGTSAGIPHDNIIGMGYQTYGGDGDLWGSGGFYPNQINHFYFGVAIAATNPTDLAVNGFIDHVGLTVYFQDTTKRNNVELSVEAEAMSFYLVERQLFGALFNGLMIPESFYTV